MEKIRFGKTELMVSRIAFGGIPIQRVNTQEAVDTIRGVIELGVNFIDTANGYGNSEELIGLAIKGFPRENLVITSKSLERDKEAFLRHIDLSLTRLGTDYIDLYQIHNIATSQTYDEVFREGGVYEGLMEAVRAGKVRFPAFSSHHIPTAIRVMKEQDVAAVQLPFNYVDDTAAIEAIPLAKELDMGFIAMKPFGGGLLSDAKTSMKYLMQFDSIVPDPGIEKLSEMEEIVRIVEAGGIFDADDEAIVARHKEEFSGIWCHRCEYCQPCPQKINISFALNIESVTIRMNYEQSVKLGGPVMETARTCTECRACADRCPYGLDIPGLLKEKQVFWENFIA